MSRLIRRRATVALVALGLDGAFGELPNLYHPVAWLGSGIERAERSGGAASSTLRKAATGSALLGIFGVAAALAGLGAVRVSKLLPGAAGILLEASVLKQTFACRALFEHASAVETALRAGDLGAARLAASQMVSRPTADLSDNLVASAAIESLSENFSDSVVAPLSWYLVAGLPGAMLYRTVNTLDAMVGYHSKGWLGTPSARADDVLNLAPSRLTAGAFAIASGRPLKTLHGVRTDHGRTPSPNSGWPMAAMAYALVVRLEKSGHHVLNSSARLPRSTDIARARRLTLVTVAMLIAALVTLPQCNRGSR